MRCSHKLYEKEAAAQQHCPICQREAIGWLASELYSDEISEEAQVGIQWLAELLVESAERYASHQVDCYRPDGTGCTCGYDFWLIRAKEALELIGMTAELGGDNGS